MTWSFKGRKEGRNGGRKEGRKKKGLPWWGSGYNIKSKLIN